MKIFLLVVLAIFCQLFNTSVAIKRKVSDEIEIISTILKEYSLENLGVLDVYFNEKFFIERYTDAQLRDMDKLNEVLLKNIFPGYSKNNESQHIVENDCRDKLNEEKLHPNDELFSYFNGYLIKVGDAWKIRKVDDNRIAYLNVDNQNVMNLLEFLYAFSRKIDNMDRYDTQKLLALIKIKYQLEEATKETGRSMTKVEKNFWKKHKLGSDLIQKVVKLKYVFDEFQHEKDELYFGVDGDKHVVYKHLGNVTFARVFEEHLGNFNFALSYYNRMRDQFAAKDAVKEFIESLKGLHENAGTIEEKVEIVNVEKVKENTSETEQSDAKAVDDFSIKGNFLF